MWVQWLRTAEPQQRVGEDSGGGAGEPSPQGLGLVVRQAQRFGQLADRRLDAVAQL